MKSSDRNNLNEAGLPADTTDYHDTAEDAVGVTDRGQPVVAGRGDAQKTRLDHLRDKSLDTQVIPFRSAATTFHAEDADNEEKYDKFWKYHHQWDEDDTARRTHKDKIHTAKSLATTLRLSKRQTDRVVGIVSELNGRRFNKYGGIEALALGAISYVRDRAIENNEHADPDELLKKRLIGSEEFNDLCEQHDVDGWKACKKVKEIYRKRGSYQPSNSENPPHVEGDADVDTVVID